MSQFDNLPPVQRAFINEYDVMEYKAWRTSHQPLSKYETELRLRLGFSDTTPVVWNSYER